MRLMGSRAAVSGAIILRGTGPLLFPCSHVSPLLRSSPSRCLLSTSSTSVASPATGAPSPVSAEELGTIPGATVGNDDGFYVLMFTCRKCETRTARRISKQGYHHGSVLVRCPGCLGLHLIADHLGYFSDEAVDAESLLKERGEAALTKGGDSSVYELGREDLAVLSSKGRSVRLRTGEELDVVTFSGAVAAARENNEGTGSSKG